MFPFRQPPQLGSTFSELVDYSRKTTAGFEKKLSPTAQTCMDCPKSHKACMFCFVFVSPFKNQESGVAHYGQRVLF